MKQVSGQIFMWTIIIAVIAMVVTYMLGMQSFKTMHQCTVDKTTKKATCLN